jgi:hypothetical protein
MARTPKPDTTETTLVCAECFPTGPPEGATSVGCEHGEWDLTTTTAVGVGVVPVAVAAAAAPTAGSTAPTALAEPPPANPAE